MWLSIGGQARARGEYFRHYLFGSSEPEDTDAYLLLRFRLNADLHVTPYFRMFAECKRERLLWTGSGSTSASGSSRSWQRERHTAEMENEAASLLGGAWGL